MGFCVVALLDVQRMRPGIVVQTRYVPKLEGKVYGGLAVHRKECAVFGEVVIGPHGHMESLLDVRHRAGEPQVPFFSGSVDYFKATRLRESNQSVPILLAGSEPRCKLLRRKELVVGGAGGILNFLHEVLQSCAVT